MIIFAEKNYTNDQSPYADFSSVAKAVDEANIEFEQNTILVLNQLYVVTRIRQKGTLDWGNWVCRIPVDMHDSITQGVITAQRHSLSMAANVVNAILYSDENGGDTIDKHATSSNNHPNSQVEHSTPQPLEQNVTNSNPDIQKALNSIYKFVTQYERNIRRLMFVATGKNIPPQDLTLREINLAVQLLHKAYGRFE